MCGIAGIHYADAACEPPGTPIERMAACCASLPLRYAHLPGRQMQSHALFDEAAISRLPDTRARARAGACDTEHAA